MAEHQIYCFDEKSQLWVQPFSELINCMFPVEYVYGEWIWWQATSGAKRSFNPESLLSSLPSMVESGSRVEGFCIPQFLFSESDEGFLNVPLDKQKHWQPDLDEMKVDASSIKNEKNEVIPIFTVEHTSDDPRYVHLRFTDEWKEDNPRYKNTTFVNHSYLFIGKHFGFKRNTSLSEDWAYEVHGPARKLLSKRYVHNENDKLGVFKYPLAWPEPAMKWLVRPRTNGWPSPELLQDILESGCHLAPVGRGKRQNEPMEFLNYHRNPEKTSSLCWKADQENPNDHYMMDETEWRLSFSVAENKLGQSVSPVQRHVLVLLKMIKKVYFPDVISSYLLKNLLFWEIENQDPSFWTESNSAKCLLLIIDRLQKSLEEGHLAHYIIPQSNLLQNEDPSKLAEGAAVIGDVRRNILTKVVSLLKRCFSLTYQSQIYLNNLQDLDPLLVKVQDKSLAEEDVNGLIFSLLAVFIKKSKDVIKHLLEGLQNEGEDENIKEMMFVPLNAYQSLLARILCRTWYLQPDKSSDEKSNEEGFIFFVKQEAKNLFMDEEFINLALNYLRWSRDGREASDVVPNTSVMENTKGIYEKLARHQVGKVDTMYNKKMGWLQKSDLHEIQIKVSERLKGLLENLTLDDVEEELNKEIQMLYEKRHQKPQN